LRKHASTRTFFGIACLCVLGLAAFLGSSAPTVGADESFPGQGFLPDNRAWEMVSPPDKAGGSIIPTSSRSRAATDGNAISFPSLQNFGDSVGGSVATEYIAERSASPEPGDNGWSTHAITPPQEPLSNTLLAASVEPHYTGEFSSNLDAGVFLAFTPLTADPSVENAFNLYVRRDLLDSGAGEYHLLTACPVCAQNGPLPPLPTGFLAAFGAQNLAPYLAAATPDLSRVIFESRWNLTGDAPPQPECSPGIFGGFACVARLYEWADGTVRLAGILPEGRVTAATQTGGNSHENEVQSVTVAASSGQFKLSFESQSTADLPYDASPAAVQSALEALGAIGAGNVSVSGGPGNTGGNHPYLISFEAALGEQDVEQIGAADGSSPLREGAAEVSLAGVGAGGESNTSAGLTPHTISDGSDGHSRVFFTVPTDDNENISAESRKGDLYVRTDGTTSDQLNASERTDCAGDPTCGGDGIPDPAPTPFRPATYLDASADGERVFLMTEQALTDDAPNDGQNKIYMYDTTKPGSAPDNLTYLDTGVTGMRGMVGASADGHYAYLASTGAIGTITLWHDGTTVEFSPGVGPNEAENLPSRAGGPLSPRQSRVTPDGRYMLYRTVAAGYQALYLYSADTNQVTCVSCNPSGVSVGEGPSDAALADSGASLQDHHETHALSDDGRYVFFSTDEPLVARDINGVSDAYEFDTQTGEPHLLSSGESPQPSYFLDASADGSDAFISTTEPLSRWDVDGSRDIYDARVNGGFPEPAPPPPSCQGDACQPNPTQLNDPTPASSSFKGLGNQKGANRSRCAKGQHRVKARSGKTRCVKRRHHKRTANNNRRAGR
jgi:hypothetical protein